MKPKLARRNEPDYYIRLTEEAAEEGPFSIDLLRRKAGAGEISKETWFRLADAEEYRRLGEDGPLAADFWPDSEPVALEGESPPEAGREEAEEERPPPRMYEPAEGFDWTTLLRFKWLALRWGLAIGLIVWGIRLWGASGDDAAVGFRGLIPIGIAGLLIAFDLTRLAASPVTSMVDNLMAGGGVGKTADYWTADSHLAQGEYQLAVAEYRRIVLEHPRELQAYLKGIRAARALENEKEADRFRELALKNLKSEQDRNLFLSSLERMK